ncbi:efflux RND transporter permease subunit [Planctomyces sp. SH-PL14]|uniref:efflux RND transporter permease subunit n=1 Tax=Planctomyces sp. SH-PL14 TaxID=1632864 RepID=UPI00078BB535|nr:multidrug efflux RND transporter permease subunit [Planctomyces sp. SH-PL14]AMV20862.1 Efflux pump membrane transporter BepE [Planctomyces sp. SH-PL14]
MKFAHFFIDRPIFATVVSIVTVILGGIAYRALPVSQYPDIVPPTIVVRAVYPGASPEVIADTVATPIEQEVNGVEDMLYMSSQSTTDGVMQLTVTFKLGTDLDKAQVLVQNRVATALPRLPEDVRRQGVTTLKASADFLMFIQLISPKGEYDQLYISNYGLIQVKDALARVDGVGSVMMFGLREYSMRVWLDPDRMAHLSLTTAEVAAALRAQNVQVASGIIGQPPLEKSGDFQLIISTLGRLLDPEQFANLIVRTGQDGRVIRVKDVAKVELGGRDFSMTGYLDGMDSIGIGMTQRPGSNSLATAEAVETMMEDLSKNFPAGIEHKIVYNPTVFVRKSIESVIHTLFEAAVLVVIVVLVFLQNWRATLIPLVAIPVSLIGTFIAMAAFGFSLNMLSLFGLVLAIGIVVDDAIVVVENVERHIAAGLSPREASYKAMDEVTAAVIAIAVGLSAVFVPTAFISGISGQFYRQFALTIAVSTLLSAFNSLTLSPALCALLLRPHDAPKDWFTRVWDFLFGWFFKAFNRTFEWTTGVYARFVGWNLRKAFIPLFLYAALVGMTGWGFNKVPTGFIPAQDQQYLITVIQLPDGASLARTDAIVKQANEIIMSHPGIGHAVAFTGFSGATNSNAPNAAAIFVLPTEGKNGEAEGPPIVDQIPALQAKLGAIPDAMIFVIGPPPVQGLGTTGGYKFLVQDRGGYGTKALQEATDKLLNAAYAEMAPKKDDKGNPLPGSPLTGLFTTYRATTPQLFADVDRVKANMLKVSLTDIFDTLQANLGSSYINDFNLYGRTFQVLVQSKEDFRDQAEDIRRLKTRNASGKMVPLGSVVNVEWRSGPDRVVRYNMYPSAEVLGDTAPGFSSGQSMAAIERLAKENLPPGMAIAWTDLAYQQQLAGNTAIYIFPLCVLFVFLVHSAEYESWSLPLAIIMIAPVCLPFALLGVWVRGMDNNLITQISFVVLIGLAAKNAVLIVEFAKQLEEEGRTPFDAAVEACRLRLRPIIMTSFAFILGVLPLARATGPGFELRRVLGTAVFAGMSGVTLFGLFLTPTFYLVLRKLSMRFWGGSLGHGHHGGHGGHGHGGHPSPTSPAPHGHEAKPPVEERELQSV